MNEILGFASIGLIAVSFAYIVYCLVNGRRVRSQMTRVGDDNTAAVRENTNAVREHTEVLRQYLAQKASDAP